MNCLENKSKKYFFEVHPKASKNFYCEKLEKYLKEEPNISKDELNKFQAIIKDLKKRNYRFSNDHRLEIFYRRIISQFTGPIKKIIKKGFIGTISAKKEIAYASEVKNGLYYIAFENRFRDLLDLIPNHYIIFILANSENPISKEHQQTINLDMEDGIQKLINFSEKTIDDTYPIPEEYYVDWRTNSIPELNHIYHITSGTYFFGVYYFIIMHELAHHLLEHTGLYTGKVSELLLNYKDFWELSETSSWRKNEFEADSLALLLLLTNTQKKNKLPIGHSDILVGTILSFIILALCHGDFTLDSNRHPSPIRRIENILPSKKFLC